MTDSKNKLVVRSKVWLELDGTPFIGEGRLALLRAIDRFGSLMKASQETQISYRRVRGIIREMEVHIDRPLVITNRGGNNGGGAVLTTAARDLIKRFERQQSGIRDGVDNTFKRVFDGFVFE